MLIVDKIEINVNFILQPDESGIILLADAPADEFEDDDFLNSLNGPPSPCDVLFENDNVLIDGKSSISKHPKKHKVNTTTILIKTSLKTGILKNKS